MCNKFKSIVIVILVVLPSIITAQCITDSVVSHIGCYGDNTGYINITVGSNPATTLYFWTGPVGFSSVAEDISSLVAGDYQLIVNDPSTSCSDTFNSTIEQPPQISAEFTISGLCQTGDSADVSTSVLGGTPPYTYDWSIGGVATASIQGLAPGWYGLTVTDAHGCPPVLLSCPITLPPPLEAFMSIGDADCKDDNTGYIQAHISGGTSPYDFYWQNNIIDLDRANASIVGNLLAGTYAVEIIDDMGCVLQDTATVIHNPRTCLEVYSAFSPNEDSNNDFWEIKNIEFYPEALVEVYNRTGDRVFRRRNYQNTLTNAFIGKIDQKRLPSATYYYIIDLGNGDEPFTGTVTIVR